MSFSSALSFLIALKICRATSGARPERGLVEQQEARAAHQRAPDRKHLLLAAGERAAALRDALLEAREQGEHPFEVGLEMRGIAGGRAHLEVFHHRHAHEDAAAFRRLRDPQPRDLVRRQLR